MPAIATAAGKALLLGPKSWPYLLLARFNGDKAAPLPSPLMVDVGTLTVVDGTGASQTGGALVLSGTSVSAWAIRATSTFARQAGRALLWTAQGSLLNARPVGGWNAVAHESNLNVTYGFDFNNNIRLRINGNAVDTLALPATPICLAAILRGAAGGWILYRSGLSGPYTLAYVSAANASSSLYAGFGANSGENPRGTYDDFRVVDLGGAWASDYGIATSRAVNPAGSATIYPHTADSVIELTFTYKTASTFSLYTRYVDDNNNWRIATNGSGNLVLQSVIAGVFIARISGGLMSDGVSYRAVLVSEGNVYRLYLADASVGTYTDAGSSFTTQQGMRLQSAGSGGVQELVAWPRTIALPSGV